MFFARPCSKKFVKSPTGTFGFCCGSRYNPSASQDQLIGNNVGIMLKENEGGDVEHKSEKVDVDIIKTRVGNITVSIRHAW